MDSGDRYEAPYQILDTDYKEYLVMYKCREEYRVPKEMDDLNPVQEDFRSMAEDFDEKVHPVKLANKTVSSMGPNEDFKKLRDMINSVPTARVGDSQLGEELKLFGETVPDPISTFPTKEPTLDVWKLRRDLYTVTHEEPTEAEVDEAQKEDEKLPTDKMWLHDMRISVFFRKPYNLKDEQYRDIALKFRERLPSVNWDEIMQYVEHKDENCIRGDIFNHPNRKKFEDLHLLDRGEHKQTQEMFDEYADEQQRKIDSGEIPDPDKDGEGDQEEMSQEDITKFAQEQQERKADLSGSGGANGSKDKVQSILDGMGMEMQDAEADKEEEEH